MPDIGKEVSEGVRKVAIYRGGLQCEGELGDGYTMGFELERLG